MTNAERFGFNLYQLQYLKTHAIYGNATVHTNLNTYKYITEISKSIQVPQASLEPELRQLKSLANGIQMFSIFFPAIMLTQEFFLLAM